MDNALIQKLRDDLAFSAGYKSEKHPGAEAVVITTQAAVKAALDELDQWRAGHRHIIEVPKLTKKQKNMPSPVPVLPWVDYGNPRQG
jgi:hypothetical protein